MTAGALLQRLRARGVSIVVDGGELVCRPRSHITPEEITALREMKIELVRLLRVPQAGSARSRPVCFGCREARFWRSIYGVVVCSTCHPPADESLVVERFGEAMHAR